ncbi:16S rRNA (guanine(527)-N(7))-methyltransferase RsmG [Sphingomonas glaciei]|uniref:Ribosomal RNA small subunit methyltransferase G n=1 Tax=Sphingomonas glaciei TaxID=2938948 RepID=A0ABY5MU53_9SPHN|nr:16S rRNA (guanine(527)-N(7))-methyltransferase RsmG [Sphingomonas glaciei]UUR07301.1 16S rRNA (guanine(527)-N(7))-methyltransferase RsmG [Sphingomonas glaciei]
MQLQHFVELLLAENERQNLISKGSADAVWKRHIDDSLQLLDLAPAGANWLDIGSGPGLPGIVLAIAGARNVTLVEPRRLRTDFLERCRDALGLDNVTVITGKVEQINGNYEVITARAVASLDRLFAMAAPLLLPGGRWVLPKGRSAEKELEEARVTWHGEFRLVPSRTDPDARILLAQGVRRRARRG